MRTIPGPYAVEYDKGRKVHALHTGWIVRVACGREPLLSVHVFARRLFWDIRPEDRCRSCERSLRAQENAKP